MSTRIKKKELNLTHRLSLPHKMIHFMSQQKTKTTKNKVGVTIFFIQSGLMIDKTQHNEKKLAQKKTVKDKYLKLLSMYK